MDKSAYHDFHEHLRNLAEMQKRTADIHQQFLDHQAESQRMFRDLVELCRGSANIAVQEKSPHSLPVTESESVDPVKVIADVDQAFDQGEVNQQVPEDSIEQTVFSIICAKTGYPQSILEDNLEIERDLGIDSIKRVEIMAALQDRYVCLASLGSEDFMNLGTLSDLISLIKNDGQKASPVVESSELQEEPADKGEEEGVVLEYEADPIFQVSPDMPIECQEVDTGEQVDSEQNREVPEADHEIAIAAVESDSPSDKAAPLVEDHSPTQERRILRFKEVDQLDTQIQNLEPGAKVWVCDDGSNLARNIVLKFRESGFRPKLLSLSFVDRMKEPEELDALVILSPIKFEGRGSRLLLNGTKMMRLCLPALKRSASKMLALVTRHGGYFGDSALEHVSQVYTSSLGALVNSIELEGLPSIHVDLARDFTDGTQAASRLLEAVLHGTQKQLGVFKNKFTYPIWESLELNALAGLAEHESQDAYVISGGSAERALMLAKAYLEQPGKLNKIFVLNSQACVSEDNRISWQELNLASELSIIQCLEEIQKDHAITSLIHFGQDFNEEGEKGFLTFVDQNFKLLTAIDRMQMDSLKSLTLIPVQTCSSQPLVSTYLTLCHSIFQNFASYYSSRRDLVYVHCVSLEESMHDSQLVSILLNEVREKSNHVISWASPEPEVLDELSSQWLCVSGLVNQAVQPVLCDLQEQDEISLKIFSDENPPVVIESSVEAVDWVFDIPYDRSVQTSNADLQDFKSLTKVHVLSRQGIQVSSLTAGDDTKKSIFLDEDAFVGAFEAIDLWMTSTRHTQGSLVSIDRISKVKNFGQEGCEIRVLLEAQTHQELSLNVLFMDHFSKPIMLMKGLRIGLHDPEQVSSLSQNYEASAD